MLTCHHLSIHKIFLPEIHTKKQNLFYLYENNYLKYFNKVFPIKSSAHEAVVYVKEKEEGRGKGRRQGDREGTHISSSVFSFPPKPPNIVNNVFALF
jgi:hypothetical protein